MNKICQIICMSCLFKVLIFLGPKQSLRFDYISRPHNLTSPHPPNANPTSAPSLHTPQYLYPSSFHASPSSVLPYIPLQSPSHYIHMNSFSDNRMIPFTSDKHFGLVDMDQRDWRGGKLVVLSFSPYMGLLFGPQYSR
jgi:hypothetical protein